MENVSRRTFLRVASVTFFGARLATAANLARSPYLQRVSSNSATILWTTLEAGDGSVTITSPDGTVSTFAATLTTFAASMTGLSTAFHLYQADVTGLQPGSQYSYTVTMDGAVVAADPGQSFRTPAPGAFSFLALGDSGLGSAQQLALIQQMQNETGIGKVIHVGDLAYQSGTFAQVDSNYFGANAALMRGLPFFATPGNHEYETNSAAPYLASQAAPLSNVPAADLGRYYSYDWGDAHFVSLDSNFLATSGASRMLNWLDSDLAATEKFWKIVFLHHPPYPTGAHVGDPLCVLAHEHVNHIVEQHGVQLVLSGHEHAYERSFPLADDQPVNAGLPSTTYVITGGGGYALETVGSLPQCALAVSAYHYLRVDVTGSTLTSRAVGLDGAVIDSMTLNPPPVVASALSSGAMVSIFGRNLAVRPELAAIPSASLGGVTVSANGTPALLISASPNRIDLEVPHGAIGEVLLRVTTANGSALTTVMISRDTPYRSRAAAQ